MRVLDVLDVLLDDVDKNDEDKNNRCFHDGNCKKLNRNHRFKEKKQKKKRRYGAKKKSGW